MMAVAVMASTAVIVAGTDAKGAVDGANSGTDSAADHGPQRTGRAVSAMGAFFGTAYKPLGECDGRKGDCGAHAERDDVTDLHLQVPCFMMDAISKANFGFMQPVRHSFS
jgi:hypothetical protein